jgi:hypothetical protein
LPYTVTLTNGTLLTTVADTTVDNTSSLTLVGRNFAGYGDYIAEDFVHLLENFSYATPPANPLVGQLWYNTTLAQLEIWNGTAWATSNIRGVGAITEVATDAALPAASLAASPVYLIDAYNSYNGLPALANRLGNSWYYYPSYVDKYALDVGIANALSAFIEPAPNSLAWMVGISFNINVANTNTGATTLNLNSFGAVNLINTTGVALTPGEISAGSVITVVYDGSNFQLVGGANWLNSPHFTGEPTITDASTSSESSLTISSVNNNVGANIKLIGNGSTTPNKYIRVLNGVFSLVNSAYTEQILQIDDVGNITGYGNLAVPGQITATGQIVSTGSNISAAGEVIAGTNVVAAADVLANYIQAPNITATAQIAGNTVVSNSTVTAAGAITANTGNITASTGYLVAAHGAAGTGNPAIGTILNDFLGWSAAQNGYQIFPNGLIINWGSLVVPTTGANQSVGLNYAYPNAHLAAFASFGAAPTANNYVGAAPDGNSNIAIGLIATVDNNTIYWWSIGF